LQSCIGGEAVLIRLRRLIMAFTAVVAVIAVMGIVVDVTHCLFLLSNARNPARIALRKGPQVG
jgi:hypothetical protein